MKKCSSDTDTKGLPPSGVCAGGWVILMFIVAINVLVDSFHYSWVESVTESSQATSWVFPLKNIYILEILLKNNKNKGAGSIPKGAQHVLSSLFSPSQLKLSSAQQQSHLYCMHPHEPSLEQGTACGRWPGWLLGLPPASVGSPLNASRHNTEITVPAPSETWSG